jgi:hypothetical protein
VNLRFVELGKVACSWIHMTRDVIGSCSKYYRDLENFEQCSIAAACTQKIDRYERMATIRRQVSLRYYAHRKISRRFLLDSW